MTAVMGTRELPSDDNRALHAPPDLPPRFSAKRRRRGRHYQPAPTIAVVLTDEDRAAAQHGLEEARKALHNEENA